MSQWQTIFRATMVVSIIVIFLIVDSRLRYNATNGDPNVRLTVSESNYVSNSAFFIVVVPGMLITFVFDKVIAEVTSNDKRNNNKSRDKKNKKKKRRK